jgi:tRNA(Ile)-lysidine synthase
MKNLIKTIQNTIFQQGLFERGAKIVVGVSGGPDSVCLLDMMSKIAPKADLKLIIAHVNYGLRGKDSDRDEKFVRKLAEKYNLPIAVFPKAKLSGILKLRFRKNPSENELRNVRYAFFEKIRKENNFDLIAVAHNSDDQVETFLMRIIRGAGLQGLSAMKFKNGRVIRPLLNISRAEILKYLKKTNLTYRTDGTNLENLFLRNKIRNKLIPYLEKNFNPKIRATIFGATVSIGEDADFLQQFTAQLAEEKILSVKKLLALHPALQRRVLLKKISEAEQDGQNIESAHIEEILKALRSTKGKNQIVVFKGLKLTRKGDTMVLSVWK